MADSGMNELRQRSEQYLIDMANLINRREYNLALVKGRQAMEQVVRNYARDSRVLYTDLADTIESLYQGRKIGRETRDAFHHIRLLGNKAVHEGDNSPEDAEKSYYLLKKELEVYLNKAAAQAADRTPVRVERGSLGQADRGNRRMAYQDLIDEVESEEREPRGKRDAAEPVLDSSMRRRSGEERQQRKSGGRGERSGGASGGGRARQNRVPTREDRLRAQRQQKAGRGSGLAPADFLRILLPVLCIILLIVIVRGCVKNQPEETTQASSSIAPSTAAPVTEAETETEPPTTEAQVVRYKVKGSAVNARYADNQNRVYEQLAAGTEIGEVQPIEGSDFVKFKRDGIDLLINKNYIEPIEEDAADDTAAGNRDTDTTASPDETAEGGSGRVTAVLQLEETTEAQEL